MKVLLVDDDAALREALTQTLELAGYDVVPAGSFVVAKDHIAPEFEGIVLSDIRMPGKDGFQLLEYVQSLDADLPVILLTGEGDIPMAVRGMSEGAFAFLEKPCVPAELRDAVERACNTRELVLENRRLKARLEQGDAAARMLFGQSDAAETLRKRARLVASSLADVLVCGDTGSGTYKVAEVIHLLSTRSTGPFLKRAAAGLSTTALHDALDAAGGGTLFLDEIAGLAPDAQLYLLDRTSPKQQTRLIAGSYKDLNAEVLAGRFNPDLCLRLEVLQVRIPSLRERPEDIPVLFGHYVALAAEQANLPQPEIGSDVAARLMALDWPGNARALMNEAMRFVMGLSEVSEDQDEGLAGQIARFEAAVLRNALLKSGGQASEAARALMLPRKTFYDKLTRHGIRPEDFR